MDRAGRLQTLFRLRIPSALPYFFGGLRISSGLALIGAVVAECVAGTGGRSAGPAYEILQSGFQLDIPRMFAALFLITLAGVGLFTIMTALAKLERDDFSSNHHPALSSCFARDLFRKPVPTFRDHALALGHSGPLSPGELHAVARRSRRASPSRPGSEPV